MACLHRRMVRLHTHSLTYHIFARVISRCLPCSFCNHVHKCKTVVRTVYGSSSGFEVKSWHAPRSVIAETEEDLTKRLNEWNNNVENRGMRVNMNKTKVMISGERQKPVQKAARCPCGVCGRGVGSNSIQCTSCHKWRRLRKQSDKVIYY